MKRNSNSQRRTVPLPWVVLIVIMAVTLTAGASALMLRDSTPGILAPAKAVTSAPASQEQYDGTTQVTLIPTLSDKRQIMINTSGTVTKNYAPNIMQTGKPALGVNGRTVVAMHTDMPLYRSLNVGDEGGDAKAVNNELSRLGYRSSPGSATYTATTATGWKQLMSASGNSSDGSLNMEEVVWIPASNVTVTGWQAAEGAAVQEGSAIGEIPGGISALNIKGGKASGQPRTLSAFGQSVTLPAGATGTNDSEFCRSISNTDEFKSIAESELPNGFDATVALDQPVTALRVPAAAVTGIKDGHGCIVSKGKTVPVTILGSQLGASLLQGRDGKDITGIREVALGSTVRNTPCK